MFFSNSADKIWEETYLSLVTATSTEQKSNDVENFTIMDWTLDPESESQLWHQKFQFFHFISSTQYLLFKNWNLHPKVTFTDAFGSKFLI